MAVVSVPKMSSVPVTYHTTPQSVIARLEVSKVPLVSVMFPVSVMESFIVQ